MAWGAVMHSVPFADFAADHLWTFIVRYRTVLEVPLPSSSMSCKCGTIFDLVKNI